MNTLWLTLFPLLFGATAPTLDDFDACSDADRQLYLDAILSDIRSNWNVPDTIEAIVCTVLIKQNFRGEVEQVGIAKCGDDPIVHRSITNAGYRASPMPLPDNPACFQRDVIVRLESALIDSE